MGWGSQVETARGRKSGEEEEEVAITRDGPGADGPEKRTLRTDNYSRSCPGDTHLASNGAFMWVLTVRKIRLAQKIIPTAY